MLIIDAMQQEGPQQAPPEDQTQKMRRARLSELSSPLTIPTT